MNKLKPSWQGNGQPHWRPLKHVGPSPRPLPPFNIHQNIIYNRFDIDITRNLRRGEVWGPVQGRNLRDQQKLLLVGLTQIGAKWGSLFTRETPLLGPPGYRLVQRQDPVTDSFPESDRVESVPEVGPSQGQWGIEIGPGQQPTSASRDSRMVNNQPTILVDRSIFLKVLGTQ
ncbi:hypothetical protein NE237_002204 [Protea cynaroides]|uniref:Uncharacterized protein n=1 Tax=Protea cynaroides TaxID=273540 RepID=A0A9Q0QYU7_9MAGN|nr:hypothetical protein NE237_002204 [Protea cynaroides]